MGLLAKRLEDIHIIREMKTGGQKSVQLGEITDYGKVVIKQGEYKSSSTLERIRREINFLKTIDSRFFPKNIEFIIDDEIKKFLIIEEYIESIDFDDVISEVDTDEKLLRLIYELLDGFQIIWDKRIVHRDIKPDNILFINPYKIVIIDLGIARFKDLESLTNSIALRGPCTPIFAAPEQLINRKTIINPRTDFFCLGILLSIIRYNQHPFDPQLINPQKDIIENILTEDHIDFEQQLNASAEISYLFKKLLAKEQYLRFRNYSQILSYLKNGRQL